MVGRMKVQKNVQKAVFPVAGLGTRFLPMHRVEAMYLDEASSGAPSLAETFRNRTGQEARAFLVSPPQPPTA